MPIKFHCPKCYRLYSLEDRYAGKMARCKCGNRVQIPGIPSPTKNQQAVDYNKSIPQRSEQKPDVRPTCDKAKTEDAKAMSMAQTGTLTASFFESWGLYLMNILRVWGFVFIAGFRAIGAVFTGKLDQIALAIIDFFVRLKAKDPSPN